MNAIMPIGVDGGTGNALHFEDLAAIGQVRDEPIGPQYAKPFLIHIDIDRVLRIENVVECNEHDTRFLGSLDNRTEGGGVLHDLDAMEARAQRGRVRVLAAQPAAHALFVHGGHRIGLQRVRRRLHRQRVSAPLDLRLASANRGKRTR